MMRLGKMGKRKEKLMMKERDKKKDEVNCGDKMIGGSIKLIKYGKIWEYRDT
jgi:hypothetical protein